jgi:hypothetical protein
MAGETVECYNCGHENPAWAQVCRNCGTAIRPGGTQAPQGPVPTDQDSLISMAAGVGAIALAIVLGLFLSGLIPEAPVASGSSSPEPSATATARPTRTPRPTVEATAEPTPVPTPELIGTVIFGTGRNSATLEITGVTDAFGPGVPFCHSITLTERFGVATIQEEVIRLEDDGSLNVVQPRQGSDLGVRSGSSFASYCVSSTNPLISGWGTGTFILRDYRGADANPELIAEGRFTFAN